EPFEEVVDQFRLKIAYCANGHLRVDHRVRPAAEIDRRDGERFVPRHYEIGRTIDAALVADGLRNGLTECDAGVFHGVVLIDIKVAGRRHLEIETTVPRDEIQHVI